ncbi:MAG: hypothetical protein JWP87_2040 [Labilithrix sp.]|nr:hypothetical protein [Labilithrix sp.]
MGRTPETRASAVVALRDAFFDAHVLAHPEDGSTLGLREHTGRLSDPSRGAAEIELAQLRATLHEAEVIDATDATDATETSGLDADLRLDLDAVLRAARHHSRWLERDEDASNLELALLPNGAVQHALLHVEDEEHAEAVARRTEAVPEFLARHLENLRRGARERRGPDRVVSEAFVERVLPGACSSMQAVASGVVARALHHGVTLPSAMVERLARAGSAASEAYRTFTHAIAEEIVPAARHGVCLGAEETAFRLRDTMGLDSSIDALCTLAERSLERAHRDLVEHCRAAGHSDVKTAEDAREVVLGVLAPKPASVEEAVALYERHLDGATRFVEERGLVPVPEGLALELEPLPAGIADGIVLTNWPAPLLDARGKGHALYAAIASEHAIVQCKNLAVHEGIPGHYLQSACWQRGTPSAVRFLGVTDDVAMSRSYFGTMLSVEGWAVHMEQLLCEEGFYDDGAERIFFAFCDAIRAMRVLLDLGLHARGLAEEDAVKMVMKATMMSEGWARSQVLRSKRIPMQSLTYLVGCEEIRALRRGAGRDVDALSFHRALLEMGPVPPSKLRNAFA